MIEIGTPCRDGGVMRRPDAGQRANRPAVIGHSLPSGSRLLPPRGRATSTSSSSARVPPAWRPRWPPAPSRTALIVTKDTLDAGSTAWAQGGMAGVLDPSDSVENHVRDTLAAGAGLCDEAAVRTLVAEAPEAVRYLMRLGAAFDPSHEGTGPALTREGGHCHNRIVHAGGDQSGAEVQRTLDENAVAAGVEVMDRAFALDLLVGTDADGEPSGRRRPHRPHRRRRRRSCRSGSCTARAVVIATGGYGQVFASTSNPPAVTGDGLALALRAGLPARDVEFVQFHPTVLWRGADATGQQALISEAVRGEGAILFDAAGDG